MAWGKKVSVGFKRFVYQMCLDFNIKDAQGVVQPSWMMTCMAFETIETFSPTIMPTRKDGSLISSAVGLIQLLKARAIEIGTTREALLKMTAEEQLPWVWKYFKLVMGQRRVTELRTIEDCYMAIHWPNAVGKPLSATMYVDGSEEFKANRGLDLNKDGTITKAEAGKLIRDKLAKGMQPAYFG